MKKFIIISLLVIFCAVTLYTATNLRSSRFDYALYDDTKEAGGTAAADFDTSAVLFYKSSNLFTIVVYDTVGAELLEIAPDSFFFRNGGMDLGDSITIEGSNYLREWFWSGDSLGLVMYHADSTKLDTAYAFQSDETTGAITGGWTDDGTVVRLTAAGDTVGIGTTSPDQKLHVAGQVKQDSITSGGMNFINANTAKTIAVTNQNDWEHYTSAGKDVFTLYPATEDSLNISESSDTLIVEQPGVYEFTFRNSSYLASGKYLIYAIAIGDTNTIIGEAYSECGSIYRSYSASGRYSITTANTKVYPCFKNTGGSSNLSCKSASFDVTFIRPID